MSTPPRSVDLTRPLPSAAGPEVAQFLQSLQGHILKGHGRSYATHFVLRFDRDFPKTARAWLAHFAATAVTSAWEQQQAAARRKDSLARGETVKEELFAMVALSAKGYEALGFTNEQLPVDRADAFRSGMGGRFPSDPPQSTWEPPYDGEVHALVVLAHEDYETLNVAAQVVEKSLRRFCEVVRREEAQKRVASFETGEKVVEHFGYADGISQPLFFQDDIDQEVKERGNSQWDPTAGLDLVLVEESAGSQTYGSFMVFRKIEEDVPAYIALVNRLAAQMGKSQDEVGARLMGRKPDGTPLVDTTVPAPNAAPNDFNYDSDLTGAQCPFSAHIRKVNPRNDLKNQTGASPGSLEWRPFRIARRGITYGSGVPSAALSLPEGPTQQVGLFFISFQSGLDAFEALQLRVQDTNFVKPGAGLDAVLGAPAPQTAQTSQAVAALAPANAPVDYERAADGSLAGLVRFKGGEYFFAPSLPFLQTLAPQRTVLTDDEKQQFSAGLKTLLADPNLLRQFGEKWQSYDHGRVAAASVVQISKQTFDDLYAYLAPFMPSLDDSSPAQRDISLTQPSGDQVARFEQAFQQLLDPAKLQAFAELWAADHEKALNSVNLTGQEAASFYAYLRGFQINIGQIFWL